MYIYLNELFLKGIINIVAMKLYRFGKFQVRWIKEMENQQ